MFEVIDGFIEALFDALDEIEINVLVENKGEYV